MVELMVVIPLSLPFPAIRVNLTTNYGYLANDKSNIIAEEI